MSRLFPFYRQSSALSRRSKLKSLLGFVFLCLSLQLQAQTKENCFPIWQGFSQHWGYNHRIHRLGDWVAATGNANECKVALGHAAASGSGADVAEFTQYYAWIQSDLLHFQEGVTTLELSGKEGEFIAVVEEDEANFSTNTDPEANFEVLLDGFDLRTGEGAKADKIQSLDMEIDSVWRDKSAGKIRFRLKAAIRFACSTAECEALNQIVDYQLRLHWIAIEGPGFQRIRSSYGSGRDWEKNDTATPPPMAKVAMLGDARYPTASAGITGLHMLLDREAHMLAWESRIQPFDYKNGLLTLGLRMDFVQNHPTMYAAYKERFEGKIRPPARRTVKRKAGNMVWEMDVTMLQFEDASVSYHLRKGSVAWHTRHGKQISADGIEAESNADVELGE
ncbi:MAG: hypothetical protein RLZZ519_2696 [Bacteroidota bacterium]|jgi:hypothetical protein